MRSTIGRPVPLTGLAPAPLAVIGAYLAASALLAAGCSDDDPVSPQTIAGTYTLVELLGQEPPAVVFSGGSCTLPRGYIGYVQVVVHDGNLELSADSSWTLAELVESRCVPNVEGDTVSYLDPYYYWGRYTLTGDRIELTGEGDGSAVLEGARLYLFFDAWYNDDYFVYEKIPR